MATPQAARHEIEDVYPLSPLQQGMLFHSLLEPESTVYFEQIRWGLRGRLDPDGLRLAWQQTIDRHPVLRSAIVWEEDEPLHVVRGSVEVPFDELDLSGLTQDEQGARIAALLEEDRSRGFDFASAPLMRLHLIRTAAAEHELVWSFHHLLLDGWSVANVLGEVFGRYADPDRYVRNGGSVAVRPYREYIAWLAERDLDDAEAYWRRALAGFHAPTPLGVDRPVATGAPPEEPGAVRREIGAGVTRWLTGWARDRGLTLYTLVQGAWALLLSRYSGERDVVFGATVAGRPAELPGVERMVGLFINSLPVRVTVDGEAAVEPWLASLQSSLAEVREHEATPLAQIQAWSELEPGAALFESVLAFESFPLDAEPDHPVAGLEFVPRGAREHTHYALSFAVVPGDSLKLNLFYDRRRFDEPTIERLAEHFTHLLVSLAESPQPRLADLSPLTAAEREEVLVEWNDTALDADYLPVHEMVARHAAARPEAPAVVMGDEELSYGELDARANQVAHHLRALGVGRKAIVGLCAERSIELIVGLVGILKAGAAYVPLDPEYPPERLAFMIADTAAPVLLTQRAIAPRLPEHDAAVVLLDADRPAIEARPTTPLGLAAPPSLRAAVIYTSGSTGRPKGVMFEHGGLANLARAQVELFAVPADGRVLQFSSISFDAATWETVMALWAGAALCLSGRGSAFSGDDLVAQLREDRITIATIPPSALTMAEPGDLPDLDVLVTAGEACPPELARCWSPGRRFFNAYGPTETTVCATALHVTDPAAATIPIGRPIANARVYIVDEHFEPTAVGVPGELCVGGAGVTRGYLNRPGLTAERFVPDPFGEPGGRLYRTGDLARRRADGTIEFLGRIDHQVKVRGFRIELGEVEAALASHPGVREAVAVARGEGAERRLVGYVVRGEDPPGPSELRAWLERTLPRHMVPAAFVALDAFPLTPNGKVDRKALPEPEGERPELRFRYVPPRTPTEEVVAGVWADVLGLDRVGVHDSFFELGGDSIVSIQVVARVRALLGVDLSLRDLFDASTVAALGETVQRALEAGITAPAPIEPVSRDEGLPLSFGQQRLWFIDQLEGGAAYNTSIALRLAGALEVDALRTALAGVVDRHEILRTTFPAVDGEPSQVIAATAVAAGLEVRDLSGLPEEERGAEADRIAAADVRRPFDLAGGPLLRALLLRRSAHDHVLVLSMHHIVCDGWSLGVLTRDLGALYRAAVAEAAPALDPLPVQYADFAVWQRRRLAGEELDRQLGFWREELAGLPELLELPADRPRPPVQSLHGAAHPFTVDADVTAALKELARDHDATLFVVLLAAFGVLLSRFARERDIAVGTPVAGRGAQETEDLVGFFVNTLVLRCDLAGDPSFDDLVDRVRETALRAYAHQDVPFERLVDELAPNRSLSHSPLFQVVFSLQNAPLEQVDLAGVDAEPYAVALQTTNFDLSLHVAEDDGGLSGVFEYATELFDAATIERLAARFNDVLAAVAARPERPVSDVPLLADEERSVVLDEWALSRVDVPAVAVHRLVAQWAAVTPDAIALVSEQETLSYRELDARANRLARHLIACGVRPESLVGVCLERSVELVVALLAVLKAGAAFVPLDPDYPAERLGWMLEPAEGCAGRAPVDRAAGLRRGLRAAERR